MGEINIPPNEQEALAKLDVSKISDLIEKATREHWVGDLRPYLANCGLYISGRLYAFEQSLAKHREAKSPKKRETAARDVRDAASDLSHAVWSMKRRMETEQKDAEQFFIDDDILEPFRFSKRLSVRVSYRWRRAVEDPWTYASILFTHDHDPLPDYSNPAPKRKPSAAQQARDLQKTLYETWDQLRSRALCSVRDYFKDGGDGAKIPETFHATVDRYSRGLNNYSTQFWRQQA